MTNHVNEPVTSEDILFKLSDVLFSPDAESFINIIRKVDSDANFRLKIDMEQFRKLSEDDQRKLLIDIHEENKNKVKEKVIEFTLDGEHYELRDDVQERNISLAHYKNDTVKDFSSLDKPVSKDIDSFKNDLQAISKEFDIKDFSKAKPENHDKFYYSIVASRRFQTISHYISDEALALLQKLKPLFSTDEQNHINFLNETKFERYTERFKGQLYTYFINWIEMLQDKKHDVANPFEFNDLDNHSYYHIDASYLAVVQESQNTIFIYLYDKKSDRFKVWTCANIRSNCDYEMNYFSTYKDLMKSIGDPYGYYIFPIEMSGVTYPKSAQYYIEHFDDESEFLVFDSTKGFRVNSFYSDCMATDVPLLTSVLSRM